MSYATSKHLSERQLRAVASVGDILVPPGNKFPSFSESGCLYNIDTVLAPTPASDVNDLKMVLTLFSVMPIGLLRWLLERLEIGDNMPDWTNFLSAPIRLLLFALRGIIFSLYYSGQGNPYKPNTVFEVMDYNVSCKPDAPAAKTNKKKSTQDKTSP